MKLTIAKRLTPIIATAVLGVTFMGAISNYMTNKVYESTNYANENVIPSLIILDQLRKNYLLTRLDSYRLVFALNGVDTEGLENKIRESQDSIETTFKKYEFSGCYGISCFADEDDKKYLYEEKALWKEINTSLNAVLTQIHQRQNGWAEESELLMKTTALSQQLQAKIDQHIDYNVDLGKRTANAAEVVKNKAIIFLIFIAITTLAIISFIGYISTRSILKQLGGEPEDAAAIATQLALGNLKHVIKLTPGDTTSLMAKIKLLIQSMENVANRADAVGQGNLSDEVDVLSENDRLGQAINHMVVSLRTVRIMDDKRRWLSEGKSQLSQALNGDYTEQQIAQIFLSCIGRYLEVGRGVIYKPHPSSAVLTLLASYMFSEGFDPKTNFQFGEGAIGQVAIEKKPILLTIFDKQTPPIITGTINALPQCTYTYPLMREKELLGVIELSSFHELNELQLDYLLDSFELASSFLYVAGQRGQIQHLLTLAEQAERDVRKQNDYLQEANSRMEEQQQQLQQQAEELQQSNAQMEEQQQQLQQQSEELQQTNAQMEEQQLLLEQNNEELRQSQNDIDEKAKQLALSNHYKSEFLANMSHELRTPLNAIILLSKMMSDNPDGNLSESEIKRAEVIYRSGQDLLRLISDVLDLSKVDAGRMDLNLTPVASSVILSELNDLFNSTAQQNGIEFIMADHFKSSFVSDYQKLSQILRNLLSNAFKFTKKGSVTLVFERVENQPLPIHIIVKDTGIGIPKNKTKTVFDAFRQVDGSTSREYGGTGLGLTISLRFAELLGGTITLTSTEGVGSSFTLCLPEMSEESPTPAEPVSYSPPPALNPAIPADLILDDRTNLRTKDKIILLIDDDPNFGIAVIEINHRLGYKTIVANTGEEGIKLAKKYHPTGILLDLGLPDKDGTDILHELKSNRELAAIPVYIISGRDHDSTLNQQEIVGYLQKPVVSSQIAEAESTLLSAIALASEGGVLLVTTTTQKSQDIHRLLAISDQSASYQISQVTPGEALQDALDSHVWGVVIINLEELSIPAGLEVAKLVRAIHSNSAMVFFGVEHLTEEEEASLRHYSDSIIINAPQAGQRLQENIEHFLHSVPKEIKTIHPVVSPHSAAKLHEKSILVIDDDPRNLFVITAALEQQGAQVLNALNGKRALEILEKSPVDLVITDIMMPEMDGYQTITAIRANPKLATIPIVALTAKAMPHDRKNILEIGADDYLSKPVDYEVLSSISAFWCSKKHG